METGNIKNIEQDAQYQLLSRAKSDFFNVDELHNYKLALHLGISNFRVCITDTSNNRCLLIEDYQLNKSETPEQITEQLQLLYDEHHLLQAGFWNSITLSVTNQKFTLIPDSLFLEEHAKDYLATNARISNEEKVFHFKHNNSETVNIFAINQSLAAWFENAYPTKTIEIIHQTSPLIEGALHYARSENKIMLFASLENNLLTLLARKKQQILFCNTFNVNAAADFLYFILYVFQELNMNPEENSVYIFGNLKHNSEYVSLLYKYIRHVNFGEKPALLSYSYQFDDIMDHNFFEVYNIHLC